MVTTPHHVILDSHIDARDKLSEHNSLAAGGAEDHQALLRVPKKTPLTDAGVYGGAEVLCCSVLKEPLINYARSRLGHRIVVRDMLCGIHRCGYSECGLAMKNKHGK
jgi:hypothetical protein